MPAMLHLSEGGCAAELLRVIKEARFESLKHLSKNRKGWGEGISVRKQIGREDLRRQRCGEGCRRRGLRTCLACSACFWAWRTCTEGHDDSNATCNGCHLRSAHRLHPGQLLLRKVCLRTRHPLSHNGSTVEQKVSQKQQSKEGTITAPERSRQFLASAVLFLVLLTLRMSMTA